jgi:hypothetical protein
MRERIDVAKLYRPALLAMPETVDGQEPLPVLEVCPVTLDELLSEEGRTSHMSEPSEEPGLTGDIRRSSPGSAPCSWMSTASRRS